MSDDRLRLHVEAIERLLEERAAVTDDIKERYQLAKDEGYDAATIRRLISRRAMKPNDRVEGDQLLERYEAEVGGLAEPEVRTVDERAQALAIAMLADQIAGIEDPEQAQVLIGHVLFLLDLREEIRAMRAEESARKKEATAQGFDGKQIGLTVRWYEKVAKHGEDAMRAGEATFHLYRSTVDHRPDQAEPTQDETLARLFAPQPTKAPPRRVKNLSAHRAAAEHARRALRGDL